MRWKQIIREQVVVRDRAASDVDGKMRDLVILMNPTARQTEAFLRRCVEQTVRGCVGDTQAEDGVVFIWDAYLTDHAGAGDLLRKHGLPDPFPRFTMTLQQFHEGIVHAYSASISDVDWGKIPTHHLERMLGKPVRYEWQ